VRFTADMALLEQVRGSHSVAADGSFEVPVTVHVAGQTLPVVWRLRCRLASGKITLSQETFDFGSCFITHSAMVPVTLTNDSPFLQKVAFVGMPREIDIQPSSGFVSILPFRSVVQNLIFSPKSAADSSGAFTIQTKLGEKITLRYKGEGLESPFSFSETILRMEPVPDGDYGVMSTYVTNNSKKITRTLEFCIPADVASDATPETTLLAPKTQRSFLTISPKVLVLEPHQRARVEVLFEPKVMEANRLLAAPFVPALEIEEDPPEEEEDPKAKAAKAKGGKKKGEAAAEEEEEEERRRQEEKKVQQRLAREAKLEEWESNVALARTSRTLANDQREKEYPTNTMSMASNVVYSDEAPPHDPKEPWSRHAKHCIPCVVKSDQAGHENSILYLEVHTTVVMPALVASPQALTFGEVTPNSSTIKSVEIRNQSDHTLELTMLSLGVNSPFTVLNVLRSLKPGQAHFAVLEFAPRSQRNFSSELIIRAGNTTVSIALLGNCVSPKVTVEPSDSMLDMGDVLEGDTVSRSITVNNTSTFAFNYRLEKFGEQGESNVKGLSEFFFVPGESSVPAQESQEIALHFSPDHASADYQTNIQLAENQVLLKGRCHPRQMYIWAAKESSEVAASILHTVDDTLFQYQNPLELLEAQLADFAADGTPLVTSPAPAPEKAVKGARSSVVAPPKASGSAVEKDLELVFRAASDETQGGPVLRSRTIHVGSCVLNDLSSSSPGSFEFKFSESNSGCWAIDPTQRQFSKDGEDAAVTFTFNLTTYKERRAQEALGNEALLLVGQWVEIKGQFQLKGGFVPPGLEPIKTVDVLLRTFVGV
jgi:hypothetical protein